MKSLFGAVALGAAFVCGQAHAAVTITMAQSGSDVVANLSGSLNTAGLTLVLSNTGGTLSGITPRQPFLGFNGGGPNDYYSGLPGGGVFGSNGGLSTPSSSSGSSITVMDGATLYLPAGYVSGAALAATMTWTGQTLSSLGVTPGTYVWAWGSGATADSITLTITPPPVGISTSSVAGGTVGQSYTQTIAIHDGTSPYTFGVSGGALPPGLSLNPATGVISGTPTAGGSYSFTVQVTDGASNTASQTYTGVTIAPPTLALSPASLPAGAVGSAYSQALGASGGTAPYTYSISAGSLPTGLSLSSGGVISGTPSGIGGSTFTVTVRDSSTGSGPYTASATYSVAVANGIRPASMGGMGGMMGAPTLYDTSTGYGAVLMPRVIQLLSAATGYNLVAGGQSSWGIVTLGGYGPGSMSFAVTGVQPDNRPDGVYPVGDGSYMVVSGGQAMILVPALRSLDQLAALLGGGLRMSANGVLSATVGGQTFVMVPGIAVTRPTMGTGTASVGIGADGRWHFVDAQGYDQVLMPACIDPGALGAALQSIDFVAYAVQQADGTERMYAPGGVTMLLIPDPVLGTVPAGRAGQSWWMDSARHVTLVNHDPAGTTQGFTLAP